MVKIMDSRFEIVAGLLARRAQNKPDQQCQRRENQQPSNDVAETVSDGVSMNERVLGRDRTGRRGVGHGCFTRPLLPLGELTVINSCSWQSSRDVLLIASASVMRSHPRNVRNGNSGRDVAVAHNASRLLISSRA